MVSDTPASFGARLCSQLAPFETCSFGWQPWFPAASAGHARVWAQPHLHPPRPGGGGGSHTHPAQEDPGAIPLPWGGFVTSSRGDPGICARPQVRCAAGVAAPGDQTGFQELRSDSGARVPLT